MRRTKFAVKAAACMLAVSLACGSAIAQPQTGAIPGAPIPETKTKGQVVKIVVNGMQRMQLSTKKPIRAVVNEKEAVARVQAIATDPNSVMVVGLTSGTTHLTLTDVDNNTEAFDILVQPDVDAVMAVIRDAFPTANVRAIPGGNNAVVLLGNVSNPEDIEPILRITRGVTGADPYNAMTVGGVRQVQLDVSIAQVNRSEARRRNTNIIVDGSTVSIASLLPGLTLANSSQSGGAGPGVGAHPAAAFAIPLLSTGTTGANLIAGVAPANFNLLIQALRTEGLAKLLAEPKLVTMSGHPATFLAGGSQAVIGPSSGISGPGVVYQDVGTSLTFLPIVLANGKIFLEVSPETRAVDNGFGISTQFGFTPGFNVSRVSTRVTLEAGQTFAIGGLIQNTVQTTTNKVPFLGDLPFVGAAFSSVDTTDQEQELVVLVTPYLVDPMDCRQAPCKLPGNESRKPDDFELFLETILEAPRGQRCVFQNGHYVPSWKSDPTADKVPCGGANCCNGCANGNCGNGNCASGNCASGNCAGGTSGNSGAVTPVTITVSSPSR